MSGAKCVQVKRASIGEARRRNRISCEKLTTGYQRVLKEWIRTEKRLRESGQSQQLSGTRVLSLDEYKAKAEELLKVGDGCDAVDFCLASKGELEQKISDVTAASEKAMQELQERLHHFNRNQEALLKQREAIQEKALSAVSVEQGLEAIKEAKGKVSTFLDHADIPDPIDADDEDWQEKLIVSEEKLKAAESTIQHFQQDFNHFLNGLHREWIEKRLDSGESSQTVSEYFETLERSKIPEPKEEDPVLRKLEILLSRMAVLESSLPSHVTERFMGKASKVQLIESPLQRRAKFESLLIEASGHLKRIKALQSFVNEIDDLRDQLSPWTGKGYREVETLDNQLKQLRFSEEVLGLTAMKTAVQDLLTQVTAQEEARDKRLSILQTLQSLGYQLNEGMETAVVKGGRLILRKPEEGEYALELVTNQDMSLLQTELVRQDDGSATNNTDQRKMRDQQAEEAWCQDHATLMKKLNAEEFETEWKMHQAVGAQSVRVVNDANLKQSQLNHADRRKNPNLGEKEQSF